MIESKLLITGYNGRLGRAALARGGLTDVAAADRRSSRWSEWVAASG